MKRFRFFLPALCFIAANSIAGEIDQSRWQSVLSSKAGELILETASEKILWRDELKAAMAEAYDSGRPLLVTFRCLPCKQCASFDKTVLEGTPLLNPILSPFVTVRLTDASQLDQRIFPYTTHQDLDLSWWAYFLSPKGELYSVFGGKDHVSDSTRISEKALYNTLNRVLAHHRNPDRSGWEIDGPVPDLSAPVSKPQDRSGYQALVAKRPAMAEKQECLHCHQVGDVLNLELMKAGDFTPSQITDKWPLPENVGIVVDRDAGIRVESVTPGSPAQKAGIQAGDLLGMADGTRLFSQADFRGALHRASAGDTTIDLAWTREGKVMFGALSLKSGWKSGENWWRKTVYDGVYGPGMGFFPLKGPNQGKGKGLSVRPWMGKQPADRPVFATGLRPGMEIIAINGMRDDLETRKLIAWFRLNHKAGDEVTYTTRAKGGEKEFRFVLPK